MAAAAVLAAAAAVVYSTHSDVLFVWVYVHVRVCMRVSM